MYVYRDARLTDKKAAGIQQSDRGTGKYVRLIVVRQVFRQIFRQSAGKQADSRLAKH